MINTTLRFPFRIRGESFSDRFDWHYNHYIDSDVSKNFFYFLFHQIAVFVDNTLNDLRVYSFNSYITIGLCVTWSHLFAQAAIEEMKSAYRAIYFICLPLLLRSVVDSSRLAMAS